MEHTDIAVLLVKVPALQLRHCVRPIVVVKEPGKHAEQSAEVEAEYQPALQLRHTVALSVTVYVPVAQLSHRVIPDTLAKEPGRHAEQLAVVELEYQPALQFRHAESPTTAAN